MNIWEEARKQYMSVKQSYEEAESELRKMGKAIPPRSSAFYDLQSIFEPSLVDELRAENNEVPINRGTNIPRK